MHVNPTVLSRSRWQPHMFSKVVSILQQNRQRLQSRRLRQYRAGAVVLCIPHVANVTEVRFCIG
jgi:hypothetical protein